MNQITGYLDGSNVYGSGEDIMRGLRLGRGGFLRAQNVRGRAYLPANPSECASDRLACFSAGNEHTFQTSTLFTITCRLLLKIKNFTRSWLQLLFWMPQFANTRTLLEKIRAIQSSTIQIVTIDNDLI